MESLAFVPLWSTPTWCGLGCESATSGRKRAGPQCNLQLEVGTPSKWSQDVPTPPPLVERPAIKLKAE